ncbi:MAG: hypothetical protein HDS77_09360 [Bacteroidales bacterium]|nr:hypothetical protein [Bacteroidales bacterium]
MKKTFLLLLIFLSFGYAMAGPNPIVYRLSKDDMQRMDSPEAVAFKYVLAILNKDYTTMRMLHTDEMENYYMSDKHEYNFTLDQLFDYEFGSNSHMQLDILQWNEVIGNNWEVAVLYTQNEGQAYNKLGLDGSEDMNLFKVYVQCVPTNEIGVMGFQHITRYNSANVKVLVRKQSNGTYKVEGFK